MTAWIDDLHDLADAATPGPWYAAIPVKGVYRFCLANVNQWNVYMADEAPTHGTKNEDDAKYLAALSPERVRAMLAVIRQADIDVNRHQVISVEYTRLRAALDEAMK